MRTATEPPDLMDLDRPAIVPSARPTGSFPWPEFPRLGFAERLSRLSKS